MFFDWKRLVYWILVSCRRTLDVGQLRSISASELIVLIIKRQVFDFTAFKLNTDKITVSEALIN